MIEPIIVTKPAAHSPNAHARSRDRTFTGTKRNDFFAKRTQESPFSAPSAAFRLASLACANPRFEPPETRPRNAAVRIPTPLSSPLRRGAVKSATGPPVADPCHLRRTHATHGSRPRQGPHAGRCVTSAADEASGAGKGGISRFLTVASRLSQAAWSLPSARAPDNVGINSARGSVSDGPSNSC